MAASVGIKVHGARELRRSLKRAGAELTDMKDANAKVAAYVATAAASRAPRRTGRLAGSGRGNRAVSKAVVTFGGARQPYAGPIHWGWPLHGIEAQPFVVDAARQTEPTWLAMYAHDVDRIVDSIPSEVGTG